MTITIGLPSGPNNPVGPGAPLEITTDAVFDPTDSHVWQLRIWRTTAPQASFWIETFVATSTRQIIYVGTGTKQQPTNPREYPLTDFGIQIALALITNGVQSDATGIGAVWDSTSYLGELQTQLHAQAQGGFTAEDRAQLQLAVEQTTVDLTDMSLPTDIRSVPIGRLPGTSPFQWNERVGPFTLVGRGAVNLVAQGALSLWTGMRWFYTVIPPGWGMTPGAVDEFDNRPAQLAAVFEMENGEELAEPIVDTNSSGGMVQWQWSNRYTSIQYDVAPGFTVTLFMYRIQNTG